MQWLAAHEHFVRIHASIIMGRKLVMIIEPVASRRDLATYLGEPFVGTLSKLPILVQAAESRRVLREQALHEAFGCLASGLLFMHDHNIRHKDIKPGNVLVHQKLLIGKDEDPSPMSFS